MTALRSFLRRKDWSAIAEVLIVPWFVGGAIATIFSPAFTSDLVAGTIAVLWFGPFLVAFVALIVRDVRDAWRKECP